MSSPAPSDPGPPGTKRRAALLCVGSLLFAGAATAVAECWLRDVPLLAGLDQDDRAELYRLIAPMEVTLAGFLIAAVAVLASFDSSRKIVRRQKQGEAFEMTIIVMLASAAYLLLASVAAVAGLIVDDGPAGSHTLAIINEGLALAAGLTGCVGAWAFTALVY